MATHSAQEVAERLALSRAKALLENRFEQREVRSSSPRDKPQAQSQEKKLGVTGAPWEKPGQAQGRGFAEAAAKKPIATSSAPSKASQQRQREREREHEREREQEAERRTRAMERAKVTGSKRRSPPPPPPRSKKPAAKSDPKKSYRR